MLDLHVPETFSVILGMSTILSIFFGSADALVSEGDWKPFEYLAMPKDSDFLQSPDTLPIIQVQSELSEGLGWEGQHPWSLSKALHVIVSVVDSGMDERAPIPGHLIRIKSQSSLPCIVEQGNGGFDDCSLSSDESQSFVTNLLGRVSFSIPLDGVESLDHLFPPLFIQSAAMSKDQW